MYIFIMFIIHLFKKVYTDLYFNVFKTNVSHSPEYSAISAKTTSRCILDNNLKSLHLQESDSNERVKELEAVQHKANDLSATSFFTSLNSSFPDVPFSCYFLK